MQYLTHKVRLYIYYNRSIKKKKEEGKKYHHQLLEKEKRRKKTFDGKNGMRRHKLLLRIGVMVHFLDSRPNRPSIYKERQCHG